MPIFQLPPPPLTPPLTPQLTNSLKILNTLKNKNKNVSRSKNSRTKKMSMRVSGYHKISISNNKLINIFDTYLLNNKLFNYGSVTILSEPGNSASQSIVISINGTDTLDNKCFVIKYTAISNNKIRIQKSFNEFLIYKYLYNLVKYNITPFIYYGYDAITMEIDNIRFAFDYEYFKFNEMLKSEFNTQTQILFLESDICDEDLKIMSLYDYIRLSISTPNNLYFDILIILFQIIYTLKILNFLGIKHNDLHFGNILITIDNKNDNDNSCNKYIITDDGITSKEYIIPNTHISVRIFDFDMANKQEAKDISKLKLKLQNIKDFKNIDYKTVYSNSVLNNDNDIGYDILKIIYNLIIYTVNYDVIGKLIKTLINSLTVDPCYDSILAIDREKIDKNKKNKTEINETGINEEIDKWGNFKSTDVFKLKNVDDILDILVEEINYKSPTPIEKGNVDETYSMLNMYKKEYLSKNTNFNNYTTNNNNNNNNNAKRTKKSNSTV